MIYAQSLNTLTHEKVCFRKYLKMSSSPPVSNPAGNPAPNPGQPSNLDREKVYQWIIELSAPDTREAALLELSKKRETVLDLAPMLWHSFGTMSALLHVMSLQFYFHNFNRYLNYWKIQEVYTCTLLTQNNKQEYIYRALRILEIYEKYNKRK